jgi:voltage-gated potassium channel Kch
MHCGGSVQTVTTVGYGDIVPITSLGRYVAIAYMGFGIAMITTCYQPLQVIFIRKDSRLKKEKKTSTSWIFSKTN